jgi:HEAT repeat protein
MLPFALFLLVPAPLTAAVAPPVLKPDAKEPVYRGKRLRAWLAELTNKDPDVRFDAAIALGRMGPKAEAAIPKLARALRDSDRDVCYAVRMALGRIGPAAVKPLVALLRDTEVNALASDALGRIGPPAIEALIAALQDRDQETRSAAASALEDIGKPALAAVIGVLQGKKARREAVRVLGWMRLDGADQKKAVAALIAALDDPDEEVRSWIAGALTQIGTPAVSALIEVLKAGTPSARVAATLALGGMSRKARAAVPALLKALEDDDRFLRVSASQALKLIDPEAARRAKADES